MRLLCKELLQHKIKALNKKIEEFNNYKYHTSSTLINGLNEIDKRLDEIEIISKEIDRLYKNMTLLLTPYYVSGKKKGKKS